MNPSLKLFLALIISLEISLKANLLANLIVIIFCIAYLLFHHIKFKTFLLLLFVPLLAAFAMFSSIYWFSPNKNTTYAWVLFTRIYVFTFAGGCISQTTNINELIRSLEQNFKLPSKFAYGLLAAFNVIPRIKEEVHRIQVAGEMRGLHLSFWSPRLYFKAILMALNWADGLTQGMISHGFRENKPRSIIKPITLTKKDWLSFLTILLIFQPILFLK
ncbi:energy-coupling factor transporter transmembrane component T [Lactobacillus sp.]|uniref:energy-coupling factor transporter transmembrane component T family protein n=1 Tax=Lactobacillus sp. TaxID=1591 RepID=UPI0019CA49C7|nr:energy-coupling factor transporter transmembrane component T [Lactobacillus sp.]MBD5429391.1 energy-coupling factor transporter transmembrane protein EcfT [Lactobacillus sp.]MBD5430825.1 energy-coupling factor transporter transmembrane protein EcfT [Lactobacillus sp.]